MKLFSALVLFSLVQTSPAFATLQFSRSVPAPVQKQMLEDISFLESIHGGTTSALYPQIFSDSTLEGKTVSQFFQDRISNVDMNDCGGGPAVAGCVITRLSRDTMFLTNNYVTFDMPQVYRVSIILHESRHTEINHGSWTHVICPTPYLDTNGKDIVGIISGHKMEGLPACDNVILGAYGLQAILLKNIENVCTTCSEKVLMDAKIYGNDDLLRISNLPARKQMNDDLQKK
jgi:hypothetical protein